MLGAMVMVLPWQINKWHESLWDECFDVCCQTNVLNVLNAKEKIWLTVGTASYGENNGKL